MGQDQMSGGLSVLCWLAAPVAMFYRNLPKFGNNVIIGNNVQFSDKFAKIGVMSWSIKGVTVDDHVPRMSYSICVEGEFKMFHEIPISTIKLP